MSSRDLQQRPYSAKVATHLVAPRQARAATSSNWNGATGWRRTRLAGRAPGAAGRACPLVSAPRWTSGLHTKQDAVPHALLMVLSALIIPPMAMTSPTGAIRPLWPEGLRRPIAADPRRRRPATPRGMLLHENAACADRAWRTRPSTLPLGMWETGASVAVRIDSAARSAHARALGIERHRGKRPPAPGERTRMTQEGRSAETRVGCILSPILTGVASW